MVSSRHWRINSIWGIINCTQKPKIIFWCKYLIQYITLIIFDKLLLFHNFRPQQLSQAHLAHQHFVTHLKVSQPHAKRKRRGLYLSQLLLSKVNEQTSFQRAKVILHFWFLQRKVRTFFKEPNQQFLIWNLQMLFLLQDKMTSKIWFLHPVVMQIMKLRNQETKGQWICQN